MVDVEERPRETAEAGGPPPAEQPGTKRRGGSARRILYIVLGILAAVIVYAFAFDQTDVDLDELQSESRRPQLFRILRALARPDLVTFSTDQVTVAADLLVPCEPGSSVAEATGAPRLVITPNCASPGDVVTVQGEGFAANETGILSFVPTSDFDITLPLVRFNAGVDGSFATAVELPDRPSPEPQQIQAVTRVNIGSLWNFFNPFDAPTTAWNDANNNGVEDAGEIVATPRWSDNASLTWDKIIETVMLALLATTVGTALAVPLSFFAARNLMRDITTPLLTLALTAIALPVGIVAGVLLSRAARALSDPIADGLFFQITGLVILPVAIWYAVRWAIPEVELEPPTPGERTARVFVLLVSAVAAIVALILLSALALDVGETVQRNAGPLGFLGNFLARLGEILDVLIALLSALIGAGVLMFLGGRLAYVLRSRLPAAAARGLAVPLAALGGAIVGVGIGAAVDWFAEFEGTLGTFWVPLFAGAAAGLLLAVRNFQRDDVNVGLSIYYAARTLFNTLRSVEPLVMVIVFVVWIGVGPFAGALALALHTTAALAKLYSEQVESIMTGPIEAIRATGATRMQTIIYAVVPQIVPPYISFTMYRWDINVRMSTIIGFAGGGGIGFVLQQNINLLQYRAAAAQMLAIAIVVASMDYISSRLRERLV